MRFKQLSEIQTAIRDSDSDGKCPVDVIKYKTLGNMAGDHVLIARSPTEQNLALWGNAC